MSEVLSPVLVINTGWSPIHIKPTKDAIADVFADVAEIVEHSQVPLEGFDEKGNQIVSTFGTYHSWASWSALSKTAIPHLRGLASQCRENGEEEAAKAFEPRVIQTTKGLVRGPEVIRLPFYSDMPDMEIRLTRRNLLLRDGFACQYCGKRVTTHTFTIDHVIPRSRKGLGTWENFAVACFPCNVKKRDRTPEEANMRLLSKPAKPKWYPLTTRFHHKTPVSWIKFLPDAALKHRPTVLDASLSERRKK
jgi:5-methylcytosine-specific restriction endonuclease McrA